VRMELGRTPLTGSQWLLSIALMLVLFASLTLGARRLSLTMDEPSHIAAGYTLLARGQAGFWTIPLRGHPPLVDMLEALPLFLTDPDVPVESLKGWDDNFVRYVSAWRSYLVPIERTETLARMPSILFSMLLGAVVFRWTHQLWGAAAAIFALVALTFDPLLLAHGRLATNDIGVTTLGTSALYVAFQWMVKPTWRKVWLTGGMLGFTLLAKASGVLWALGFGGMALILVARKPSWQERILLISQVATALACALLLVWAAYGFSIGEVPSLPFSVPAPEHLVQLLRHVNIAQRRVFFGLGRLWFGRQWWYYPFNFLSRNPLPLLVGLVVAGSSLFKQYRLTSKTISIGVFPALYTLVAMTQGTSVGYRHMVPIHPFIYMIIGGGLWTWLRRPSRWRIGIVLALMVWYVIGTLCVFPDEITFFNELTGGPGEGYRYLVDYTQDWGQSFKELCIWLDKHPGPKPMVAHYTQIYPAFYGIDFQPFLSYPDADPVPSPLLRPSPGRYVIGVTPLQGIVGNDRMLLEWFRHAEPTAKVGNSLFVYDVEDFDGQWIAQCSTPAVPLTHDAIQTGLRLDDLREIRFDCTNSWVYPGAEQGLRNGWYSFHGSLFAPNGLQQRLLYRSPQPHNQFMARHLRDVRFAYQQEQASRLPSFVLYETKGTYQEATPISTWVAPAGTSPDQLESPVSIGESLELNGSLVFLGVRVFRAKDSLDVETWWRVTGDSITRPFSVMAHLLTPTGKVQAVADGMGVPPLTLMAGDVIVQNHRFTLAALETEVWLRTGVYWIDTMERWQVTGTAEADALFLPLHEGPE
jgi:hypothetical protein